MITACSGGSVDGGRGSPPEALFMLLLEACVSLPIVLVLPLPGLVGLALTYAAVHVIRPNSFRLRARLTRWCECSLKSTAGNGDEGLEPRLNSRPCRSRRRRATSRPCRLRRPRAWSILTVDLVLIVIQGCRAPQVRGGGGSACTGRCRAPVNRRCRGGAPGVWRGDGLDDRHRRVRGRPSSGRAKSGPAGEGIVQRERRRAGSGCKTEPLPVV